MSKEYAAAINLPKVLSADRRVIERCFNLYHSNRLGLDSQLSPYQLLQLVETGWVPQASGKGRKLRIQEIVASQIKGYESNTGREFPQYLLEKCGWTRQQILEAGKNQRYLILSKPGFNQDPERIRRISKNNESSPLSIYLNEISKYPLLTHSEEVRLAKRIAQGDKEAKNKMIEHNLRLVVSIAKVFQNRGLSLEELISEGNAGLIKAVRKFDPDMGYKFSTYSCWWIKQFIRRAIINYKTVRVPLYLVENIGQIRRKIEEYLQRKGYTPSVEEVCSDKDPETIKRIKRGLILLDRNQPPSRLENRSVKEIADSSCDPYTAPDQEEINHQVNKLLESLSERKQIILRLRSQGITLEQVGRQMGLTRERVRQIETKAINEIRKELYLPPKKRIHNSGYN